MKRKNAHKSLGKVSALRSRATERVFRLANAWYLKGKDYERKGERVKASAAYRKAQALMEKASKAGMLMGPVGRLPNPKTFRLTDAEKTKAFQRYAKRHGYFVNTVRTITRLRKEAIAEWLHAKKDDRLTAYKKNPLPVDEWNIDDDEAFALGRSAARMIGRTERDRKARPRFWHVTYYSPMRGKQVGFIRPIEAHSATDARKQAKAMVTNDKKASNFVAREVKRNPQSKVWDVKVESVKGGYSEAAVRAATKSSAIKKTRAVYKRAKDRIINLKVERATWLENPGLIDLAANLQAADYVQRAFGGSRRRNAGVKPTLKQGPTERELLADLRKYGKIDVRDYPHLDKVERRMLRLEKRGLVGRSGRYAFLLVKRNPSVRELSKTFQGKASGAVAEYKAANSAPSDLARIGKLVFIKLSGSGKQTRVPGAMVAVDSKGKLWLTANRAPMFSQKAKPGQMLDFGEVDKLCYLTAKKHIENGALTEYVHAFGEDGGKRPRLLIDHEGMPVLRGGDYKIASAGIIN